MSLEDALVTSVRLDPHYMRTALFFTTREAALIHLFVFNSSHRMGTEWDVELFIY